MIYDVFYARDEGAEWAPFRTQTHRIGDIERDLSEFDLILPKGNPYRPMQKEVGHLKGDGDRKLPMRVHAFMFVRYNDNDGKEYRIWDAKNGWRYRDGEWRGLSKSWKVDASTVPELWAREYPITDVFQATYHPKRSKLLCLISNTTSSFGIAVNSRT